MPDQKSLSCQTSKTVKVSDYTNPDLPDRRWKISYGKNQVFYLTDREHEFFLGAIYQGEKHVQVGLLTLSNNFFYINPIRGIKTVSENDIMEVVPMTDEERGKALEKMAEVKKNLVNILNKKQ